MATPVPALHVGKAPRSASTVAVCNSIILHLAPRGQETAAQADGPGWQERINDAPRAAMKGIVERGAHAATHSGARCGEAIRLSHYRKSFQTRSWSRRGQPRICCRIREHRSGATSFEAADSVGEGDQPKASSIGDFRLREQTIHQLKLR